MKINEILELNCIKVPLIGTTKEEIISELVALMAGAGLIENQPDLLRSAMEREGLMSTGIGKGVAIPHGRTRELKKMTGAFGISRQPVDFGSLDDQPVQIFFFVATPQNFIADHVKALALVSRLLNRDQVREQLVKAASAEEVLKIFSQVE
ncbi:PTS sugar transporter subunit IIA [candidate division TA06 bacterium]|nr:PTS sugar transporter subunit IIA [candidate division TA06 bacterium]